MRHRWLIFLSIILGAVVATWICRRVGSAVRGVPDAYARWDVGEILIDHLRHHDDRWPDGWESLRPSYDRLAAENRLRGGLTFDELRSRVRIDWTADPHAALRDGRPFRAVEVVSGNLLTWEGADPNEMVMDYLPRNRQAVLK